MAAGSSRLVTMLSTGLSTGRWVGIGAFLVAASVHTATMVGASQMPPVASLLERDSAPVDGTIELDLEADEFAIVGPVQVPDVEPPKQEPERVASIEEATTPPAEPDEEDVGEPPQVVQNTPQPLGVAPPITTTTDETATDETATPGAANGSAPPGAAATEGPPAAATGPVARSGGYGDLSDEYGDSTPSAPPPGVGTGSLLSEFALAPVAAAPTTTPDGKIVTGATVNNVLNGTVQSQDKKKGITFPGAGVVSGTVTTAVRALPLPHNARGTIEVTIAPGGKVTSARVVSSSAGDASAWDGAAKAIQGSLAGQTLDLGDAKDKGATVRVSVTQRHVYPTGTAKGADIKPVCANQVINDLVDSADNKPASPTEGTTIPLLTDENGRPCIPIGVSAVADASNIGAKKHIEVQASMDVTITGQKDLPVDIRPVNTDAPWVNTGKEGPKPTLPQKMRKRISDKKKKK